MSSSSALPPKAITWCGGKLMDTADVVDAKKLGEVRVYECLWDKGSPCGLWVPGDRTRLGWHMQNWHDVRLGDKQPTRCLWCGERDKNPCGQTLQKENVARHIATTHLSSTTVQCSNCRSDFSRPDAFQRHSQAATACGHATGIPVRRGSLIDTSTWQGLGAN